MPKQRLRKLFKSFVDPEKDDEFRGTKTEIDGKLQKILGFIKEEDGNDRKESIADLIEDFRNHYESLYSRYDHLAGELRKKFHGSSLSSSDSSDSDDSPTKKGERNGKVEHSFENNRAVVEQELETALLEVGELKKKLAAAVDEKETLNLEYLRKNDEIIWLEEEKRKMEIRNSGMERALIEKENEFSILQKKYDDGESEKSAKITALTADVNSLEEQLGVLGAQKSEVDLMLEKQSREISEFLIQIEKLKEELFKAESKHTELMDKIVEHETEMKEQNDAFVKLGEDHKELEVQFRNCEESLRSSENEIEQLKDQIRKIIDAKNQDINQLEETIEDLKTDLEINEDEINTLMDNMRTTEVKQRLTSQKLRITEQVLGEKEDSHQQRVDKLVEEQKLLEERIASLLEIISTYKEAQSKMVSEVSEKINETQMGIDTFSVKFEEDYSHLESRVFEIANELKVIINWITGNNAEKDQLKKEIASLLQQLKDEKAKIGELEMILLKDEIERESLIQTVKQQEEKMGELEKMIEERDEKMGELERKMSEKDSGILSLSEEKREAIRQLCIWIDYHHNRYDDLKDMILKTRGGRR